MKMSFIPSKLGLRTHPLTQINLGRGACCRGEGEICIVCCFSTPPHVRPDDQITKEALSRFPQRRVGLEATRLRQPATSALTSESRHPPPPRGSPLTAAGRRRRPPAPSSHCPGQKSPCVGRKESRGFGVGSQTEGGVNTVAGP